MHRSKRSARRHVCHLISFSAVCKTVPISRCRGKGENPDCRMLTGWESRQGGCLLRTGLLKEAYRDGVVSMQQWVFKGGGGRELKEPSGMRTSEFKKGNGAPVRKFSRSGSSYPHKHN